MLDALLLAIFTTLVGAFIATLFMLAIVLIAGSLLTFYASINKFVNDIFGVSYWWLTLIVSIIVIFIFYLIGKVVIN